MEPSWPVLHHFMGEKEAFFTLNLTSYRKFVTWTDLATIYTQTVHLDPASYSFQKRGAIGRFEGIQIPSHQYNCFILLDR
jgi:hypothetical protein